jgi:trk system potassium uptake protein TrkH
MVFKNMINVRVVLISLGMFAIFSAILMMPSLVIELATNSENDVAFVKSIIMSLFFGILLFTVNYKKIKNVNKQTPLSACILLIRMNYKQIRNINKKTAFLLTGLAWFVIPIFASLPFYFSHYEMSFVDSIFEATSGITTTGASVIPVIEGISKGLLMWRAILQFVGGIGIVIFILLIIPSITTGSAYLLNAESGSSSKSFLHPSAFVSSVIGIYFILTLLCIFCYWFFGMEVFDAVAHGFSTVSSGGFSTHNNSLAFYKGNLGIEVTAIIFMITSVLPFTFLISALIRRRLILDYQMLIFFGILTLSYVLLSVLYLDIEELTSLQAIRYAIFNVTTIITSTGFATNNYINLNVGFNFAILILLAIIGGCSGSTAGGIKIARVKTMLFFVRYKIQTFEANQNILNMSQRLASKLDSAMVMIIFYFLTLWVGTLIVSGAGYDFLTSLSTTISVVSNTGVGLTPPIGGSGSYAFFPSYIKMLLAFIMIAGRLEFVALYVMFFPSFWKFYHH